MRIRFRYRPSWLKSVLIGTLLGLLLAPIAYFITPYFIYQEKSIFISDDKYDAMMATCLVDNGRGTGTGVLLNTGYIITAGHVVDVNRDGIIDKSERDAEVVFYSHDGTVAATYSARVVCSVSAKKTRNDFAILEVPEDIKSNIKFNRKFVKTGRELYTIGCPKGRLPHVSLGYKSTDDYYPLKRASLNAYYGSSGGGIYINEHELVGIVKGVGVHRRSAHVSAHLAIEDGDEMAFHFIQGRASYHDVIPQWTEYTGAYNIYEYLESKNLAQLVEIQDKTINLAYPKYILLTILQVSIILLCVSLFRKELFSP